MQGLLILLPNEDQWLRKSNLVHNLLKSFLNTSLKLEDSLIMDQPHVTSPTGNWYNMTIIDHGYHYITNSPGADTEPWSSSSYR